MVTRDQLKQRALRAYERGRLRAAARIAWFVIPVALLCAGLTGRQEACACLGSLVLGVALYLRWRDRRGAYAVSAGLLAGLLPLVAGLLVARLDIDCATSSFVASGTLVCGVAGLAAGAWLGTRAARKQRTTTDALTSAFVAVLAASLGCAGLGPAGVAWTALGLFLGVGLALARARVA